MIVKEEPNEEAKEDNEEEINVEEINLEMKDNKDPKEGTTEE